MGILTRAPEAGRSKTRLAAALGEAAAARLARAFLLDVAGAVRAEASWHTAIFVEPAGGGAGVASLTGVADVRPQSLGSIGARMRAAAAALFGEGFAPVVLVGSDIPTLRREHVAAALTALRRADAVFGPAADGGYYLIALRRPSDALFADTIPWSTPQVLAASERAAAVEGMVTQRLAPEADVDTVRDLQALRTRLKRGAGAPHTRAALAGVSADGAAANEER